MEMWKLYNGENKALGKTVPRGSQLEEGQYYRVVVAIVINQEGKILITRRSKNKVNYPNYLECTCGSLLEDEDPSLGIQREIKEEVGLKISLEDLEFLGILKQRNKFSYVYLVETKAQDDDLNFPLEEVSGGGFYSKADFLEKLQGQDYAEPMKERLVWAYDHYIDRLK